MFIYAMAELPELSILLFNVNGDNLAGNWRRQRRVFQRGEPAAERRRCMEYILSNVNAHVYPNLFVLCQDNIDSLKHEVLRNELRITHRDILYTNHAGVYPESHKGYRSTFVGLAIQQQVDRGFVVPPQGTYLILGRLMVWVLTPRNGSDEKILLVSWHGPNGRRGPSAQTRRTNFFRRLVSFSETLKVRLSCAIVILGGDFNLSESHARQEMDTFRQRGVVDGDVLADYETTTDRQHLPLLDYIIYWPSHKLLNTVTQVICPNYMRTRGGRPFDHPIVLYRFGDACEKKAREFGNIHIYDDVDAFADETRRYRNLARRMQADDHWWSR